jgi:hypothetical protein|tara:strand:+ start:525 stop:752 length:228 start_codon:yes stop_codon:yes gene_type:complete
MVAQEICIECDNESDDINTEGFCATCADWFVEGKEKTFLKETPIIDNLKKAAVIIGGGLLMGGFMWLVIFTLMAA